MTLPQSLAFAVIIVAMALFAWGRFRYDLVALTALGASIALGTVPPEKAFAGFGDDIVIIVAGALVTSAAIARSGVMDQLVRRAAGRLSRPGLQIAALAGSTMALSGFVKNIGALSMLIPAAFQFARRTGTSASQLLMPMAFASLLGGLVTLVGTSPNVIVSRIRAETVGEGYAMFDFTPVGLPLALLGLAFLVVGYRLLPKRRAAGGIDAAFAAQGYTVEAVVPEGAAIAGKTAADLAALGHGDIAVTALIRDVHKRYRNPTTQVIRPGDHILLEGQPADLDALVAAAKLTLPKAEERKPAVLDPDDEAGLVEAVVSPNSFMIDWSPERMRLWDRFRVEVVAVSRAGERVASRLKNFRFAAGDVVVLRGNLKAMPEILGALGCLPLAPRGVAIGARRAAWVPVAILVAAMLLMAFHLVTVPVAFFGAAVLMVLAGALSAREAYGALDPPLLVMLAALIPVSDALRSTGATDLISNWLSAAAHGLPAIAALALIMVVAMAVTPFLNNAATVLVAGPIAAGFAKQLGYSPDPFLMAVAIGAACDFLTPVGHQCNLLVMGPGCYRFGDYWKLGLPLSILVVAAGVPLIAFFWPLGRPG